MEREGESGSERGRVEKDGGREREKGERERVRVGGERD